MFQEGPIKTLDGEEVKKKWSHNNNSSSKKLEFKLRDCNKQV